MLLSDIQIYMHFEEAGELLLIQYLQWIAEKVNLCCEIQWTKRDAEEFHDLFMWLILGCC